MKPSLKGSLMQGGRSVSYHRRGPDTMTVPVNPWTHTRVARPTITVQLVRGAISRGIRQRCPVCGLGPIFSGFFRMRDDCSCCGVSFTRESGQWLGSMDINLTISLLVVMTPTIFLPDMSLAHRLVLGATGSIALPALLFRSVRGFWLALLFLSGAVY